MQIIWYGGSCFKITSSETIILTDPFSPQKSGFKNPKISSPGIIIFSSEEEKIKTPSENFLIFTPGEYEIKNVFIKGIPHFEKKKLKIIYQIEIEELKICFLGKISERLTDEELEKLDEINILLLPVLNKETAKIINEIEPNIIIPSCWKDEKELDPFLKETGFKKGGFLDKFKINKKDILKEKIEFFILKPHI